MTSGSRMQPQRSGRDDAVIKLFYQFVQPGPNLFLKDRISHKMLSDALGHLGPIPSEEWALCMIENPLVQYPIDKILLTVKGIYWWDGETNQKKQVLYSQLTSVRFLQTRESQDEELGNSLGQFIFGDFFQEKTPEYKSVLYLHYADGQRVETLNLSNLNTDQLNMISTFIRGALMIQEEAPSNQPVQSAEPEQPQWQLRDKKSQVLLGPFTREWIEIMIEDGRISPQDYMARLSSSIKWLDFEDDEQLKPLLARANASPVFNIMSPKDLVDFGLAPAGSSIAPTTAEPTAIDLNRASLEVLLTLTDLTLAMAEKLIQERTTRNGFQSVEAVGEFLALAPHQVVRLKREAMVKALSPKKSKRTRIVDY